MFTSEISLHQIPFLDLMIYVKEGQLHSRLYTRPTDRHIYLNYHSKHQCSLKESTPYSVSHTEESPFSIITYFGSTSTFLFLVLREGLPT